MHRCYAILSLVFACVIVANSSLFAQNRTLDREFEPVILAGSAFPRFAGVPITGAENELFLFAYRDSQWRQIPHQVDEIGSSGDTLSGYFVPDDGLLDDDDELSFMAKDAGDQAPDTWIGDAGSQTNDRYKIEITDPLAPEKKAWVYLYRSSSLANDPDLADYVAYYESKTGDAGEDTVRTAFYEMAHSTGGFPKDLLITKAGGGNGQDLFDVLKLRASLVLFGFEANITEENIALLDEEADSVRVIDGRIRVIRELEATFQVVINFPFATPPLFYYPNSHAFDIGIPDLSDVGGTLASGRLSIDLNPNAANMKFVSANNPEPGFVIDGAADEMPNDEVDGLLPGNNWMYINGAQQGTIVHLFPLDPSVGGSRQLYYKDDSTDDPDDTSDRMSYGDTGIAVGDTILPPVVFSYRGYFLGGDFDSNIGSQIAAFESNPFEVTETSQSFDEVTSVERVEEAGIPETFVLTQNFPNPFNPTTSIEYQISGTLSNDKKTTLKIYNLLGEEVRTLVDEKHSPGVYSVTWDGRDNLGKEVTSGVYIYRLQSGNFVQSKKMIFVK